MIFAPRMQLQCNEDVQPDSNCKVRQVFLENWIAKTNEEENLLCFNLRFNDVTSVKRKEESKGRVDLKLD